VNSARSTILSDPAGSVFLNVFLGFVFFGLVVFDPAIPGKTLNGLFLQLKLVSKD
jgi:hypothetical protein